MSKKLSTSGFRLPAKKTGGELAPEIIDAFADEELGSSGAQPRELASSPNSDTEVRAGNPSTPSRSKTRGSRAAGGGRESAVSPGSPTRPRSGTGDQPYLRVDGKATRSTTVHLEVELHRSLRIRALEENRSMSEVVAEAVRIYLRP